MDLSWSPDHQADASTILTNLQLEVKKNLNELTTNVDQLNNVSSALNQGKNTFGEILCETCKSAVESKYNELHSEDNQPQSTKKYKTLAPERQRIVNEITKVFIELERSQSSTEGDEQYCTQEEYFTQRMVELENTFKKDLQSKQTEIADLKKQVKKLTSEREEYNKNVKSMSGHVTSNGKFERDLRKYQSENKRLQSNLESSERRNEQLRRDVERSEEDLRKQRQLFEEERERREANITDGRIRSVHGDLYTSNVEMARSEDEVEGYTKERAQLRGSERETGQTTGLVQRSYNNNVSSSNHQVDPSGDVDSTKEETLQKLKQIEKGAMIVQKENDEYRRDITQLRTERKTMEDKNVSLQRTNEEMSEVMRDLQRDNERLIRERDEYNSDLVKMRRGSDRYDRDHDERYIRDIEKLEREKRRLEDQNESLRRANEDTSSALRDLKRDHDSLTEELGVKERETREMKRAMEDLQQLESRPLDEHNSDRVTSRRGSGRHDRDQDERYKRDIEKLEKEKRILQEENESLRKANEDLKRNHDGLTEHLGVKERETDDMNRALEGGQIQKRRSLDDYNSDLDEIRRGSNKYDKDQNEKYKRDIEKLEREKRELQRQVESLRRANEDTSSDLSDLRRDHGGLREELGVKVRETYQMKRVLDKMQPQERKSLVMRIRRGYRSGVGRAMVDMVFKELKTKLEGRFDSENITFSIVLSSTQTNVQTVDSGPMFVLCLNTYVQVALGNIKDDRDTYILALHQIDQENLSLLTPTGNSLTQRDLHKLGGLLDMAFSSDDGLYDCDLNKTAVDEIVSVLKQY